jgi:hypothetical protein
VFETCVTGILLESLYGISDTILLDFTDSEYHTIIPIFLNITDTTNMNSITNITNVTNNANITHYPFSILSILPILPITNVTIITYMPILPILLTLLSYSILLILPSITIFLNIINFIQCYIDNIHNYYPILQVQYYPILHWGQYYTIEQILPNITCSILLNIPKPQNYVFSVQYVSIIVNITRLNQYLPIFTNFTSATCR